MRRTPAPLDSGASRRDVDDRRTRAEQKARASRVGSRVSTSPQQLLERVGRQLRRRAIVGPNRFGQRRLVGIDKAHPTEFGRGRTVIEVFDGRSGFWIHNPGQPGHPARQLHERERALPATLGLALTDAIHVDLIAKLSRPTK